MSNIIDETLEDTEEEGEISIEHSFYSNSYEVSYSEDDAYIEFMQYPSQNGIVPTVRIYLSPMNFVDLADIIKDVYSENLDEVNKD